MNVTGVEITNALEKLNKSLKLQICRFRLKSIDICHRALQSGDSQNLKIESLQISCLNYLTNK